MTTSISGRPRARTLLVGAAAALATAFAAAPASAAVTLDWSTANTFGPSATPTLNRTWLGYTTGNLANGTPAGANGTVSASDGASGSAVTPTSPRGAGEIATWSFPATAGTIDTDDLTGEMAFEGTVSFVSPAAPAGHGFTITVEDPRIVLNGAGGELYASGLSSAGPYDASLPIFTLDTAAVTTKLHADGTRVLEGFAPTVVNSPRVFPGNYRNGAGPDRTPNTFGSFAIAVSPNTGPKGDKGDTGATGPAGRNGANGTNGTNGRDGTTTTVRIQTSSLARAPFSGRAARKVRVTTRRGNRTLATGTVKGRTLNVTLVRGSARKALKGTYRLRLVGGRGSAVVTLP